MAADTTLKCWQHRQNSTTSFSCLKPKPFKKKLFTSYRLTALLVINSIIGYISRDDLQNQSDVCPSICLSVQSRHFQNPEALRSLGQHRQDFACIFYVLWEHKTSRMQNFEFHPLRCEGAPKN